MIHLIRKLYRKLLQRLCRRELKAIADVYPAPLNELIEYYDFMAIQAINEENIGQKRILGISIRTVQELVKRQVIRAESS